MRTAIITRKDKTTLNIVTSEELYLEQLGRAEPRIKLNNGVNEVAVGAGVFRVLSKSPVRVTADTQDTQVAFTTDDKDGGPIDPLIATSGLDPTTVAEFLLDAKGLSAR
ncbi:MAG TPA: hypothetical protein VGD37_24250 [Kofleriaceae bacterium]